MTCPEVVSHLDDYADGALPAETSARVRAHLDGCASCRREYEATRRLKEVLASSRTPDPGPEYFRETEALIRARVAAGPGADEERSGRSAAGAVSSQRASLARAILSVAASLAILFAAIYIGTREGTREARVSSRTAPVLATADVRHLLGDDGAAVFTQADQARIARGMMLLGSPGLLGRFAAFPEFSRTTPQGDS